MTLATSLTGLLLTISGLFFLIVTIYLAIKLITGWIEKMVGGNKHEKDAKR